MHGLTPVSMINFGVHLDDGVFEVRVPVISCISAVIRLIPCLA
jgi:hypothetical protein